MCLPTSRAWRAEMKFFRWNKHYLGWGLTAFIVIIASVIVATMLVNIESIGKGIGNFLSAISPIIYGMVIAYLLAPVVSFFERRVLGRMFTKSDKPFAEIANHDAAGSEKTGSETTDSEKYTHLKLYVRNPPRRIVSIVITFIIFIGIIVGVLVAIIPQLTNTIKLLVDNIPTYMTNLVSWTQEMFTNYPEIGAELTNIIKDAGSTLRSFLSTSILPQMGDYLGFLTNGIMSLVGLLMNLIFGVVVAIYCLYSKELFAAQSKKVLYSAVSIKRANAMITGIRKIHRSFGNFITGTIIDSFVVGCITFIVTTIAQVPFALLVSVVMGITNIIPYFGPFIGLVPSLFLIFMEDPVMCIVFTVIVLIIQNVNGNIISPRILGESTGLTSFWVIFAILVGQATFGFWGLIIGIPLFAVIYSAFKAFVAGKLSAKGLPPGSDEYTDIDVINEADMTPVSLTETLAAEQEAKAAKEAEEKENKRKKREEKKARLEETIGGIVSGQNNTDGRKKTNGSKKGSGRKRR